MKKDRKKLYGKALAVFLVVMVVCTILSRAADSMTIPQVTAQKAESGKITFELTGNGTLEATEKNTCLLPAGVLVESCLENGTAVEAGAVLIQFQKEQLEQRKKELETAWKQAELQLAQAKLDQTEAAWIPAEDEAQTVLNQAQKEYNEATAALSQTQSAYDAAVAASRNQSEPVSEGTVLDGTQPDGEPTLDGTQPDREPMMDGEQSGGQDSALTGTQAGNSPSAANQEIAELESALEGAKSRMSLAQQSLSSAQQSLESAKKSDDVTRQNNSRSKQAAGYTVENAQMEVDNAKEKLQEVENLIAREGKITAEEKGIFYNTSVSAGSLTSGSEFVGIGTGGVTFQTEISSANREKLKVGDTISIKLPGQDEIETPIKQLTVKSEKQEEENSQETYILKAELPAETEISGETASFSISKDSEQKYENIIPLTAIHQDSKGYYCLGIRTRDSILGEEVKAERITVTILDKDSSNAAVEGAIQFDTKIIVTSEKDVSPGDRVRVKE